MDHQHMTGIGKVSMSSLSNYFIYSSISGTFHTTTHHAKTSMTAGHVPGYYEMEGQSMQNRERPTPLTQLEAIRPPMTSTLNLRSRQHEQGCCYDPDALQIKWIKAQTPSTRVITAPAATERHRPEWIGCGSRTDYLFQELCWSLALQHALVHGFSCELWVCPLTSRSTVSVLPRPFSGPATLSESQQHRSPWDAKLENWLLVALNTAWTVEAPGSRKVPISEWQVDLLY
ncbi:hypothetical protein V5799_008776 [Amblyomma americanum]|uniref:Uncharacterized protein n=1 Tax=Amblyomma americanum TaxID=6943 RepID=A0AAQ4FCG8_AMBAM